MNGGLHNLCNSFGFTGYQFDNLTELWFAQSRYYYSQLGRFGAEDSAKDRLNWYEYCYGNPVVWVDPSGMSGNPFNNFPRTTSNPINDFFNIYAWGRSGGRVPSTTTIPFSDVIRHAGDRVADMASSVWETTTNFWNTHVYGERRVYVTYVGTQGVAYASTRETTTVQNPERTGQIFVRTTTITNSFGNPSFSEGFSANIPRIASIGGSLGTKGPRIDASLRIPGISNTSASVGADGIRGSQSLGININGHGFMATGNVGLLGPEIANIGLSGRAGWQNSWVGVGGDLALNPFHPSRVFTFNERTDRNTTTYTETGVRFSSAAGLAIGLISLAYVALVFSTKGGALALKPQYVAIVAALAVVGFRNDVCSDLSN